MSKEKPQAVAKLDEIQEGKALVVEVDGTEILLTRQEGKVCACGNSCPHYGATLSDGRIENGTVVCPWHYAEFDLTGGQRLEPPAVSDLPVWETRVADNKVYLERRLDPKLEMPAGSDTRRVLIVGGGAAGQAAAETLRREGFAGEIIIFSEDTELPYDRPALSKNILTGEGKKSWLSLRNADFYKKLQIDIRLNHKVVSLDPKAKLVELEDGSRESGNIILLASGSTPRRIPLQGFDGPGSYVLRTLADAEKLVAGLKGVRRAVLIGAGFISLEAAASLRARDIKVDVVAPEEILLEKVFGAEIGRRIQSIHEQQGVTFHLGRKPVEVLRDTGINGVLLDNETKIDTDLVLMAVGVAPSIDYLEGSGLVENGEIRVGADFQSAEPGIYAAGDIARFPHRHGDTRIEHWITAQKEGIHAARAMLGNHADFNGMPIFWTKQYSYSFKYIGYGGSFDRTVIHGSLEDDSWIAGHYRGDTLAGASSFGRGAELLAVRDLMLAGKKIAEDDFRKGKFQPA